MSETTPLVEGLAADALADSATDRDAVFALCGAIAAIADVTDDPANMLTRAIGALREFRDGRAERSAPIALERIEIALADVGAEHDPDPFWDAKVRAALGIPDPDPDPEDKS